jgi:hypothetical protein
MVIETLHRHAEMIQLNPLVIDFRQCEPSRDAPTDEFYCTWYELTDSIKYLPGISSKVSYKACFYDLPTGIQTHVYAPTGLDIQEKWSVAGNMPGEQRERVELGLIDALREGLYLREDVNMSCNTLTARFVRKTLERAHETLVERLILRADLMRARFANMQQSPEISSPYHSTSIPGSESSQAQVSVVPRNQITSRSYHHEPGFSSSHREYQPYRPRLPEELHEGSREVPVPLPLRPRLRILNMESVPLYKQMLELE